MIASARQTLEEIAEGERTSATAAIVIRKHPSSLGKCVRNLPSNAVRAIRTTADLETRGVARGGVDDGLATLAAGVETPE